MNESLAKQIDELLKNVNWEIQAHADATICQLKADINNLIENQNQNEETPNNT